MDAASGTPHLAPPTRLRPLPRLRSLPHAPAPCRAPIPTRYRAVRRSKHAPDQPEAGFPEAVGVPDPRCARTSGDLCRAEPTGGRSASHGRDVCPRALCPRAHSPGPVARRPARLLAAAAVVWAAAMALHAWVPNAGVNAGSLFQTLLPWTGLGVPVLLGLAAVRRSRIAAVAVLAPAVVWATLFGGALTDKRSGGGDLTVVSHNVNEGNTDPAGDRARARRGGRGRPGARRTVRRGGDRLLPRTGRRLSASRGDRRGRHLEQVPAGGREGGADHAVDPRAARHGPDPGRARRRLRGPSGVGTGLGGRVHHGPAQRGGP